MARKETPNGHKPGVQVLRTARLVFSGAYEGVEVRLRLSLPLRAALNLQDIDENDIEGSFSRFGDIALLEWNVLDGEGQPIPANGEGMLIIPVDLASLIVKNWQEAIGQVPGPLEPPSEDGSMSPAVSIVMGG